MKHRQFKTECICLVVINGETFTCKDLREAKRKIYTLGPREEKYRVDVIEKNTGIVNDIYLMKYTKGGPIFSRNYKTEETKTRKARHSYYSNYTEKN